MNIGIIMSTVFLLLKFFKIDVYSITTVMLYVSVILLFIGDYKMKLEVYGLGKKNTFQEKVR